MGNKVTPRTLSGFMELLPQDQLKFDKIVRTLQDVYASYGFLPLDTPILESSEAVSYTHLDVYKRQAWF